MANWKSFGRVLYGCLPGDYRNRNSGLMDHVNKDHMHVNLFGKSLQANHTHAVIYTRGTHRKIPRHRVGGGGCPRGPYFFFSETFLFGWLWDILGHFSNIWFNSEPLEAQCGHWTELERSNESGKLCYRLGMLYPDWSCHSKHQSLW